MLRKEDDTTYTFTENITSKTVGPRDSLGDTHVSYFIFIRTYQIS